MTSKAIDIQAPELMRAFPTSEFIRGLRFRLRAEDTLDVNMTCGFSVPDRDEGYGVEIRRGVAQFYEYLPDDADVVLQMDRSALDNLLTGNLEAQGIDGVHAGNPQALLAALFESGNASLSKGTAEDLQRFLGYFDPINREPIPLTVR
ncbi:MAG: hypothetical protein E2P02_16240 [Acidobacteria bacterium]|nr:MAG: hypothetical protein E2P02_16240 [Acidobacteriota bacterium]